MKREASFWIKLKNGQIQCFLCSHKCKIDFDKYGVCGVRKNINGKLFSLIYGKSSSLASDPIEKKPLYHFHPGSRAFSLGTIGCNFKCSHCQNYSISTADLSYQYLRDITPEESVNQAIENDCKVIAWTYNEPTIWYEFTYDSAKIAKKEGLFTVYVTNGYIGGEALNEISPYLDAMNIDVKAFNDDFYRKICKARLKPVLDTCERAKRLGIHIEITYLVIPGKNDNELEIRNFCKWIVDKLGNDTPVHFSRFHPDYMMKDSSVTPQQTLFLIYDIAKESGLQYPYLGNISSGKHEQTLCPNCGNILIERNGFNVNLKGLDGVKCAKCNANIPVIL